MLCIIGQSTKTPLTCNLPDAPKVLTFTKILFCRGECYTTKGSFASFENTIQVKGILSVFPIVFYVA